MPVPQDIFEKAVPQLQDWTEEPVVATETPRAKKGFSVAESLAQSGKELGASAATGFARGSDFLKSVVAGVLMPLVPERGTPAGEAAWSLLKPSMDTFSKETKERAENPKTVIGKVLGPMAEGIGGMATMPIPGGGVGQFLARNALSGAGMGEGAEIGKYVGGGLAGALSPDARQTGEVVGSILGGGLGAPLNVTRAATIGEGLRRPFEVAAKVKPAFDAARAQQAAGDTRRLWEIFSDEFGNLRASTRGIVGEFTNRELASAIGRDIRAMSQSEKFGEDIKQSGAETEVKMKGAAGQETTVKPWGLGERTMAPAITRLSKERAPKTFDEGVEMDVMAKARQKSIADAYNNIAGDKPLATNEGAEAAGKLMQRVTQQKLDAMTAEQARIKQSFPELTSRQEFDLGEKLRQQRDELNKKSLGVANQKYASAEQAFDEEGAQIGVEGIRDRGKAILEDFIAQANPAEVPPVVRSLLGATKEKAPPESLLILPKSVKPPEPEPKTITLSDANDLTRALTRMESDYRYQNRFPEMNRARTLKEEVLAAVENSPASPEAKQAYAEARRYWAEEHAPRFREDIGKALGTERGGAFAGRETVEGQKIMDRFMADETGMREFERIYGNNSQAKTALRAAIEGRYRDRVLNGGKTPEQFEIMTQRFKNDYDSVLSRFPEVAEKIDNQAASTLYLMREKDKEIARYADLMKGPVTKAIGPVQAKMLYGSVLADPVKMDNFLASVPKIKGDVAKQMAKEVFLQANPMRGGEYDASALVDMLLAGKSDPTRQSSLEKLFAAAYGPAVAKKHMATLESIANLSLREAATNPVNLRPGSLLSESPIKEQTGQTMASWISAWSRQESGMTGSGYFTILGLSRFANAKAQAAVEAAKLKALYDPDTAEAILQMAKTPSNQPIGASALRKIFGNLTTGDGKKLVDKLIDAGYTGQHVSRGVAYGAEKVMSQ